MISSVKILGIIVYNKSEDKTAAKGIDCNFSFIYTINTDDQNLLRDRIKNLITQYKYIRKHQSGYISLKDFYQQLVYYYNFKNWIIFLVLSSDNIIDFFPKFTEIMLFLRSKIDVIDDVEKMIDNIHLKLLPKGITYICDRCDIELCIPKITITDIQLFIDKKA